MSGLHIIEKPIYEEFKKLKDLKEREILSWVWYNFQQYKEGSLTKEYFKETLLLGVEDILSR